MSGSCEVKNKPKTLKDFFKSKIFWKSFIAVILGGTGGFLFYYFIGCSNGSCAITGNPYSSIVFGSIFGLFISTNKCGC